MRISFVETPHPIVDLMVSLLPSNKTLSILDPGCGKGRFLQTLLGHDYTELVGIELDHRLVLHCREHIPSAVIHEGDFLRWDPPVPFDVIIGNPPYAHYNALPAPIQERVATLTHTKETDIYYAFILRAIDLLIDGGTLIFIVPYPFFYNTHAAHLRHRLQTEGTINLVIDLDETRLFEGEHPETIIFRFVKMMDLPFMEVLRVKHRNATPSQIRDKVIQTLQMKEGNGLFTYEVRKPFDTPIWSSHKGFEIEHFQLLSDCAFIGVGMVSGFDQAFRLDGNESLNARERDLVIQCAKSVHCKGFWMDGYTEYLLTNTIKTEEELQTYPNIHKLFEPHKDRMSNRYLPSKTKWFQWQALRNFKSYQKYERMPKIFVPTLDRHKKNRFSMLASGLIYPAGDVIAIIPLSIDPYFLLGYLNSQFFREYYLAYGGRRGHRIAFTQRLLSNVKIPMFTQEVKDRVSHLVRDILINHDTVKREEIDRIINYSMNWTAMVCTECGKEFKVQKKFSNSMNYPLASVCSKCLYT
jgi:adenine-specific DNA-methyltransferase